MKRLITSLFALALLSGCASRGSEWANFLDDYQMPTGQTARFETINSIRDFAQSIPTPLPGKTPFDHSEAYRGQYLKGFDIGWNSAVGGRSMQITEAQVRRNPHFAQGFADGQKEYTEPLKRFLNRMQKSMRNMHR